MDQKHYTTPKGVDERDVDYPPEYDEKQIRTFKRMGIKFTIWNGIMMAMGLGISPHYFNSIKTKLKKIESVIIAVLAGPGKGKSWLALRICEIFDHNFNPYVQIIFYRSQLLDIITGKVKLKFGQVVMIDEAHMSMGARNWGEKEQKEFVEQIAAIRSLGLIVIIVALHADMIDKVVREFTLTYEIHMENPGIATVYERNHPRWKRSQYPTKITTIDIQMPGKDICPSPRCLQCEYLKDCHCIRAIYERLKKEFIIQRALASSNRIADKEKVPLTNKEILPLYYENKSHIEYTTHGTIKPESLLYIDSEILLLGLKRNRYRDIAYLLQKKYPNLRAPEKEETP